MQQPTELVLPDLFSSTPFIWGGRNLLFSPKNRESTEWMLSYGIFTDHKRARMGASNAELLGAYAYPYADAKGLRIACDFHMILFTLDEITDVQDAEGAKATRDTFVKALTGKSDNDDSPMAQFTKDYLKRLSSASKGVRGRFVTHCIAYIDATMQEACLRAKNEVLSVEEYTHLHRDNGGVRCCFNVIEVVLGITLPEAVFEDPNFLQVYFAAVDMICWSNDIYSYAIEYASGIEECSAVTVLMKSKGLSLQEAMDHIAEFYKDFAHTITSCKGNIRSFGTEADKAIRSYIYGLEQWVYGNLVWSFNIERYFGEEHEEVKRMGIVKLKQRKSIA